MKEFEQVQSKNNKQKPHWMQYRLTYICLRIPVKYLSFVTHTWKFNLCFPRVSELSGSHTDGGVVSDSQRSVHTGCQSAVLSRTRQPQPSGSPRLSHLISPRPSRCLMNIRPDFFSPLMIGGINDGGRVRSTTLLARLLQPALSDGRVSQVPVWRCVNGVWRDWTQRSFN